MPGEASLGVATRHVIIGSSLSKVDKDRILSELRRLCNGEIVREGIGDNSATAARNGGPES